MEDDWVERAVLRVPHIARYLNVSESSVRRLIEEGHLRTVRFSKASRGAVGVSMIELERFVREGGIERIEESEGAK